MMNTLEAAKLGQSHAERRFVLDALSAGLRADGRRPLDSRRVRLHFARAHAQSSCEVQLGRSRVRCVCSGEVAAPRPGRPTEGSIAFKTTMSPMASAAFSSMSARDLASHPVAVAIGTVVERAVRDSRTVDVETLCIISGSRVWSLSLDLQLLDDGGNLTDAATLAAVASLLHFRTPEVTVVGDGTVVERPAEDAVPMPLSLHHVPVSVTFSFFSRARREEEASVGGRNTAGLDLRGGRRSGGGLDDDDDDFGLDSLGGGSGVMVVMDPTEREEMVAEGSMTVTFNEHREVIAIHKDGGPALDQQTLRRCVVAASEKAQRAALALKAAAAEADRRQGEARRKEIMGTSAGEEAGVPSSSPSSSSSSSSSSSTPAAVQAATTAARQMVEMAF